jgi:hypothetical protein
MILYRTVDGRRDLRRAAALSNALGVLWAVTGLDGGTFKLGRRRLTLSVVTVSRLFGCTGVRWTAAALPTCTEWGMCPMYVCLN